MNRYGIGNVTDIGWVVGYLLIALGAFWAGRPPGCAQLLCRRPTLRSFVGPNLPFLGVIVVAAWQVSSITRWTGCPRSAS